MNISPEEVKRFFGGKPVPCPEYEGVKYPGLPPILDKGVEQQLNDIMNIKSRDSDVLICGYPKSGTHWTFEIVSMLLKNTTELAKEHKNMTMLEIIPDFPVLDELPSPRILDTHCKFRYLPREHIENKRKIIHVTRNPKDVCVSYFYHAQKVSMLNLMVPWDEYVRVWMSEKMPYGSWYDYIQEMERAVNDYPGLIFNFCYEDMKLNPVKQIKSLAKFLGITCTEQTAEDIAMATSFDNMQQNKFDMTSVAFGKGIIYRKGQLGDWKNHFTVGQNEEFDAQYQEKMKNCSYNFIFE